MASLTKSKNGSWRILVVCADGKRRSIRLEKGTTKKTADTIKTNIEHLNAAIASQDPLDLTVAQWLGAVKRKSPKLHNRIVRAGLTNASPKKNDSLGAFLDGFLRSKTDVKPRTEIALNDAAKRLEEFFKRSTPLEEITPARARDFKYWLENMSNKRDKPVLSEDGKTLKPKALSMNTVRRRIGRCRQIFAQAIQDGILTHNPFSGMPTTVTSNDDRYYEVTLEEFALVLAKAPNARWRALLLLARRNGFRIPSEAAKLKWEHISWEKGTVAIMRSSKTEHHKKRAVRLTPMTPDLREALLKLQTEAEDGSEFVFPDISGDSNLRTTFLKIIRRANVKPWPKLFQNLRASAATDYARTSAMFVATNICGHTEQIALEHYHRTNLQDIQRAGMALPALPDVGAQNVHDGQEVAQNAAQQSRPKQAQNRPVTRKKSGENNDYPLFSLLEEIAEAGIEPPAISIVDQMLGAQNVPRPAKCHADRVLEKLAQMAESVGLVDMAFSYRQAAQTIAISAVQAEIQAPAADEPEVAR